MAEIGHNSKDNSAIVAERLRSFVERIERVNEEIKDLQSDRKDILDEAKGVGYDAKMIREMLRLRKLDKDTRDAREHLRDTYALALGVFG